MRKILLAALGLTFAACGNNGQVKQETQDTLTAGAASKPAPPVASKGSYLYEPAISELTGLIATMPVYTIDNEDEHRAPDTILVLVTNPAINVVNPPGTDTTSEDEYPNEYGVDTIQLMTSPTDPALRKYLGRNVTLKGTFMHSINGHHFTNVLMNVQAANGD